MVNDKKLAVNDEEKITKKGLRHKKLILIMRKIA